MSGYATVYDLPTPALLVERGRLKLTDPVAAHLPAFREARLGTDQAEIQRARDRRRRQLAGRRAGGVHGCPGSPNKRPFRRDAVD